MATLKELSQAYVTKHEKATATDAKLTAQIARLQKRKDKLVYCSWIDEIVKPIVDQLKPFYPDRDIEILGPFGLCASVSIHLYEKALTEDERTSGIRNCISVTLIPTDLSTGEIMVRDYSNNTHQYKEDSIGALNGMNYPNIPVETIEDIIKHIS
jgi:hypothetical protein